MGDSIFDNGAYVPPGMSVIDHLRNGLAVSGESTLLVRDGAVVAEMDWQISHIPVGATHLSVSIGGNDALEAQGGVYDRSRFSILCTQALGRVANGVITREVWPLGNISYARL